MGKVALTVMIVLTILLILGFTIFIIVVAMRDRSTPVTATSLEPDNLQPYVSRMNWTETTRGFVVKDAFPPCYDASNEAKKIFSIIKAYNMEKKYMMLLDVYSILLCQRVQSTSRKCADTFINDRLADLNTYGADANNASAISIVKTVTNLQNNKIGKLLTMATDLIEKEIADMKKNTGVSKSDVEQIIGLNSQFYRKNYDFINKKCP